MVKNQYSSLEQQKQPGTSRKRRAAPAREGPDSFPQRSLSRASGRSSPSGGRLQGKNREMLVHVSRHLFVPLPWEEGGTIMTVTAELVAWTWERKCLKAVASLEKNGFTAVYCRTGREAAGYILAEAEHACSIGFGGSMSVRDLEVESRLLESGKEILNHGAPCLSFEERMDIMRRQLTCDLFLSGTNALTLSGLLVNIDGVGNRVASLIFGPRKVIVVAGRNKLVDGDAAAAVARVKNWASPPNARRLKYRTPCAETGVCCDCDTPERICRAVTVLERKPKYTDMRVLVVNEELGF